MKISKLVNAFLKEAEPIQGLQGSAERVVSRYKRKHGGLWVGGRIEISDSELSFSANRLNRALHEELPEVNIPIGEIDSVVYRFGWITGIIIVSHRRGEFRFRCYGAKRLVDEINRHIKKPDKSREC